MNEKSFVNVFQLCWDTILEESSACSGTLFDSEHCKVLDTTDVNFDVLENRLAYTYKYGCYNILFFEKCFLNFLNECPDFDTVFPLKNLKICSLSNGPGFDTIGLLCALLKSDKHLKSISTLNAVNIFYSWSTLYKTLIYKACNVISSKFTKRLHIKHENICLIQSDIFSSLSAEAKKCISNSNVLLMVKVFFSSKTTVNKFADSLRKIFLLLKPGTLIFFIGSKKDMNNFSRRSFLNNYVKTIYGPLKVNLDGVTIDVNYCSVIDQKPVISGSAEFAVWQKRNASDIEACKSNLKVRNKKKSKHSNCTKENALETTDYNSNSDVESEFSCSSGSKVSDTSTGLLKYYSKEFDSVSSMKYKVSTILHILSKNDSTGFAEGYSNEFDSISPVKLKISPAPQTVIQSENMNSVESYECDFIKSKISPVAQTLMDSIKPVECYSNELSLIIPGNSKISQIPQTLSSSDNKDCYNKLDSPVSVKSKISPTPPILFQGDDNNFDSAKIKISPISQMDSIKPVECYSNEILLASARNSTIFPVLQTSSQSDSIGSAIGCSNEFESSDKVKLKISPVLQTFIQSDRMNSAESYSNELDSAKYEIAAISQTLSDTISSARGYSNNSGSTETKIFASPETLHDSDGMSVECCSSELDAGTLMKSTVSVIPQFQSDDTQFVNSIFDKVGMQYDRKMDCCQQNLFQLCSVSDSINETQKEFCKSILDNGCSVMNGDKADFNQTSPRVPENTAYESEDCLNLKTKFSSSIQFTSEENTIQNTFAKETRENATECVADQHGGRDTENNPKTALQTDLPFKETSKNVKLQEMNIMAPVLTNIQKSSANLNNVEALGLHSLVKQCQSLVTALEKLIISIKNDNLKKASNVNKHYSAQTCITHHCCCVHTRCCLKTCNC